jgi:hypothetical protein
MRVEFVRTGREADRRRAGRQRVMLGVGVGVRPIGGVRMRAHHRRRAAVPMPEISAGHDRRDPRPSHRLRATVAAHTLSGNSAAIQKIEGARDCLTGKGWRVTGGPVLPAPTANVPAADGELIVGSGRRGAFVVFSRDAEAAARRANAINRDALRIGGELQRRGPVTILWAHSPTSEQRSTLDACLPTA